MNTELPKEIRDRIIAEAQHKFGDKTIYAHGQQACHIEAATEWAQKAIGFARWAAANYWLKNTANGTTWVKSVSEDDRQGRASRIAYPTNELFLIYLKENL